MSHVILHIDVVSLYCSYLCVMEWINERDALILWWIDVNFDMQTNMKDKINSNVQNVKSLTWEYVKMNVKKCNENI
jgi:hypothetical protein